MRIEGSKTCPFCGGEPEIMFHDGGKDDTYWMVMCMKCYARTTAETKEESFEKWEKRVNQSV